MEYLLNNKTTLLESSFFDRDAQLVARALLGKVVQHVVQGIWLQARIIETEAYYLEDKASHAWLGFTENRRALFQTPGTIYMYYARGGDSLNFSCRGAGNAVLVKSGYPVLMKGEGSSSLQIMQRNNPTLQGKPRPLAKLCAGQTLLCRALGLKVPDWNSCNLIQGKFQLGDDQYQPESIIQTTRLGISATRDSHLPYRFIDMKFATSCTKNPLSVRNWRNGHDYTILKA